MNGDDGQALPIGEKKDLIKQRDQDGGLIFTPPFEDTLYSISELEALLSELRGLQVPEDQRSNVQVSHWVKKRAVEALGYNTPRGFRTKEAKQHSPKFINQVMDMFVQKESNLQIWEYNPATEAEIEADWRTDRSFRFSDLRFAIIKRNAEFVIEGVKVVHADELKKWDPTGTETFKWQATIPDSYRSRDEFIFRPDDPALDVIGIRKSDLAPFEDRLDQIREKEAATLGSLAERPPDPPLLLKIEEIANRLQPLVGETIPDRGIRVTGQLFEKAVAERLGYSFEDGTISADTGSFPDLRHQLTEVKFQDSPTIDLGRHHPDSTERLEFGWNRWGLSEREIRFVIGLANKNGGNFEITGMVIVSGSRFNDLFNVTDETNSKVQMTIPGFEEIGKPEAPLLRGQDDQSKLDSQE